MVFVLWLTLSGCADTVRLTDVQPIFDAHCTRCHGPDDPAAGLDLWTDPIAATVYVPSRQADFDLVVPGDVLYSYMFHKINGTQSLAAGSGTRMPIGEPMPEDRRDLLVRWIADGARGRSPSW